MAPMPHSRRASLLLALAIVVLMSGVAAAQPSLEEIARAHLGSIAPAATARGRAEDGYVRARRVGDVARGGVVRFARVYEGYPIDGVDVVVRIAPGGRVRFVEGASPLAAPLEISPSIDADDALHRANALFAYARAGRAKPVLVPVEGRLRHAYRVMLDGAAEGGHVVHVDAVTGAILGVRATRVDLDTALVYAENPIRTPEPVVVTLDVEDGAPTLVGDVAATRSCVDTGMCTDLPNLGESYYLCVPESLASRDEDGDFLYAPPLDHTDPEDAFAEVSAFHHVGRMLARFRAITDDPTLAFVAGTELRTNILVPDRDDDALCALGEPQPDAVLVPFDNAFYDFPNEVTGDPSLIGFGQGEAADFAYDGDVVYHEAAHAMQDAVAEIGAYYLPDARGLRGDQGALSEGFADFWSAMVTGDPEIGEYVGTAVGAQSPSGALRSLVGTQACPGDLVGESHADGEIWAGALWAIWQGEAIADRPSLEKAIFEAFATTTSATTLASMASRITDEIDAALGPAASSRARQAFDVRGIGSEGCEQRVVTLGTPRVQPLMFLAPSSYGGGVAPATIQLALELPRGARRIDLNVRRVALGAEHLVGGPPRGSMLLQCGRPVTWTWGEGEARHDAEIEVPLTFLGDVELGNALAHALVDAELPAGTCYVQIVSRHPQLLALVGTSFVIDEGLPPGAGDGCGCRAAGRATPARAPWALVTVPVALLARGHRRSRARRRWRP